MEAKDGCSKKLNVLVFSNGMFNSRFQASQSVFHLYGKYGDAFELYQLAHNYNETPVEQLLQVFEQKASSTDHFIWSYLSKLSGPGWFRDAIIAKIKSINAESYINDADLRTHIQIYKDLLNMNYKVLSVAHSQGNFYANKSYDFLRENEEKNLNTNISIVSVANPDNRVADGSDYATLESDGVIKAIPMSLEPNVTNSNSGLFDHEFIKHYLEGDSSGPLIDNLIRKAMTLEILDGPTEYDTEGYLHKSLVPMKNWVNSLKKQKNVKLSLKQCLATSLFLKVENYFGETCEERNLNLLQEIGKECFTNEWSDDSGIYVYDCGLLGLQQSLTLNRSPLNETEILGNHKECHWENGKVSQRLDENLLKQAIEFIKSPTEFTR